MDRNHLLTRKYEPSRRILAVFCVICIAMMQCFVILPAVTEVVYAADSVDFRGYYSNGTSGNYSWKIGGSKDSFETYDDEGNQVTMEGYRLSKVLDSVKLGGSSNVGVNGTGISDSSEVYLVNDGGSWNLYDGDGCQVTDVNLIEANLDKQPIKITKLSTSKKKPYKGESVTISYKLEIDSFFKQTEEYKSNKEDILEINWSDSKGKVSPETTTTNDTSGSFTVKVKKSGEITISPEAGDSEFSYLNGSKTVTLNGKKNKLSVSPSKVSIKERESKSCTVKYNGQTILGTSCTWTSKSNSIATVSASGLIWGVKAGKTTVTVKYKGLSVSVPVTVKQAQTSTYSRPSYSSYHRPSYSSYRPSVRPTTGTGATSRTTATRPLATETTETAQTAAPSFQTMTVKEVYLTPMSEEPYSEDDWGEDDWEDDGWEDEDTEEDFDDDGVSFPAAAGSAAVAVAACGAGAVGRVRKFHSDMGPAVIAAAAKAAGDGKRKFRGKKNAAEEITDTVEPETTEVKPKAEEGKKAKGLRGKFRKK